MASKARTMTEGPLLSNIILYTLPVMFTGILQLLFNAADLAIVGRFCGSIYVAAVGATTALTNLIVNFFMGLSVGAGVCVAHALGSGDKERAHKAVHTALPTAFVSGIIITVIGILFSGRFLRWMGTPTDVLPLSTIYMQICFAGAFFLMVYNFCAAILRAVGDTKTPLILLTISGVINVFLNVIFVTVFNMNVDGVALATAISQAISAVLVVITLMRREDSCKFIISKMHFHKEQFMKILQIGVPAGLQSSLFAISNVIIQSSINSFGEIAVAGNAAAANIDGFLYIIVNSFSHASMNFIGQNVGAKQYKRVKQILWICLSCVCVVGIFTSALSIIFGKQLLGIYITDSARAIEVGFIRLMYLGAPYFVCGLMDTSTGALRGMGYSFVPTIISVLGVCGIRLGWIYTVFQIPAFHTLECLFLSYVVSWAITFAAQAISFGVVYKRKMRE